MHCFVISPCDEKDSFTGSLYQMGLAQGGPAVRLLEHLQEF